METAHLLAVDDDTDILYTLKAIGKAGGWQVATARDGVSALRHLETSRVDLLLLDYHMPQMDGLTLLGRIRTQWPELPVLVLTVDERQEIADTFLAEGATDFALKPVRAPDLIARIKLHLRLAATKSTAETWDRSDLPKGIHPATLSELVTVLKNAPSFLTARELSQRVGFAYQTVCRYINFLEEEGALVIRADYGTVGRPNKLVAWKR